MKLVRHNRKIIATVLVLTLFSVIMLQLAGCGGSSAKTTAAEPPPLKQLWETKRLRPQKQLRQPRLKQPQPRQRLMFPCPILTGPYQSLRHPDGI